MEKVGRYVQIFNIIDISLQRSHFVTQVMTCVRRRIDVIRLLLNIYQIEPSLDYVATYYITYFSSKFYDLSIFCNILQEK